jgi:hypothetical protein
MSTPPCENRAMNDDLISVAGGGWRRNDAATLASPLPSNRRWPGNKKKLVLTPALRRSCFLPTPLIRPVGQPNLGLAILPLPQAKDPEEN